MRDDACMTDIDLRDRVRKTWSSGDWDVISRMIAGVGPDLLDRAGVEEGMELLDVGTGSGGTVAVPAALRGARVIGADITDSWFGPARRRAEEAGVEVDWVQADVEDLPFDDECFDRVLSTFGHMFAPHHEVAATQMARVCKSGGMIATTTWLPEGPNGEMFKLLGSRMPPQPEGVTPPPAWGVQEHVEAMWAPHGLSLDFAVTSIVMEGPSEDEFVDTFLNNFGPMVTARAGLGDAWPEVAAVYRDIVRRHNQADDGTVRLEPTYLVTLARKP